MTERNPNRPPNDDPRQERTGVGVYDNDNQAVGETTTATGTRGTVDSTRRDIYDEPRTTSRTEPTGYGTTDPARRGAPIMTWIILAIVAVIILWLVFTYLL